MKIAKTDGKARIVFAEIVEADDRVHFHVVDHGCETSSGTVSIAYFEKLYGNMQTLSPTLEWSDEYRRNQMRKLLNKVGFGSGDEIDSKVESLSGFVEKTHDYLDNYR